MDYSNLTEQAGTLLESLKDEQAKLETRRSEITDQIERLEMAVSVMNGGPLPKKPNISPEARERMAENARRLNARRLNARRAEVISE